MTTSRRRKAVKLLAGILLIIILASAVYLGNYYHADMEAIAAFSAEFALPEPIPEDNLLIFQPEEPRAGFIFYPGGKVEYTAYIPLMESLASEGILCILVKMPFHLAVLDVNAADGIAQRFPQIENWYLGGHSLGGAMAASHISDHLTEYEGLVLLAAYSTADLSGSDLDVLSIYGSQDGVLNREKYAANLTHLPDDFTELRLEGGCHAWFGMYGSQKGDGIPTITPQEQIRFTAEAITAMIFPE